MKPMMTGGCSKL